MKKSIFALVSSVVLLGSALAGCGSSSSTPAGSEQNSSTPAATESKGPKVFRMNIHSEPSTADPGIAEDSTSGLVISSVFDGLMRKGEDDLPHEAVAEKVDVSEDGLTYTFHLRDSKWSNGDPVTAADFEFAWKRALDPKTASNYAYQLYYIKNGQAFNEGKIKEDQVGVKALDDKTLEVKLENPTPFFLELTCFYTYMPVNKKVVEANKEWAQEANTYVSNGPFKMVTWEHKNKIVLEKNENYWDKEEVKVDKVELAMIEDENTELSMFDNGELDWAGSPNSNLPIDAMPALKESGKLQTKPVATLYWYKFNVEQPPFNNAKIRKAFAYAINRQTIIDNILQAEQVPALSMLPPSMALKPDGYFKDHDVDTAKKLLDEGLKELGMAKLPPITISFNTSENHKKIAEAIQDSWRKDLGADVKIENTEMKVYLEKLHQGNYQVGRMGWVADFNDPINFMEAFRDKEGGNNDTNWEHPKYKELLIQSTKETDPEKRKQLLVEAEAIFMDEMPVAPIYAYTRAWVQGDNVKKGIHIDALGRPDLKRIEMK